MTRPVSSFSLAFSPAASSLSLSVFFLSHDSFSNLYYNVKPKLFLTFYWLPKTLTHQLLNPYNFMLHYFYLKKKNYNLHLTLFPTRLPLLSLSRTTIPLFHFLSLTQSYSSFHYSFLLCVFLNSSSLGISIYSLSWSFSSPFEPISPFYRRSASSKFPPPDYLFLGLNPRQPLSYQEHQSRRLKSLEADWISFFFFPFLLFFGLNSFPSLLKCVLDGAIGSRSASLQLHQFKKSLYNHIGMNCFVLMHYFPRLSFFFWFIRITSIGFWIGIRIWLLIFQLGFEVKLGFGKLRLLSLTRFLWMKSLELGKVGAFKGFIG